MENFLFLRSLRSLAANPPIWFGCGCAGLRGNGSMIGVLMDRGNGDGFAFLALDNIADYLDPAALPAPGASATWT